MLRTSLPLKYTFTVCVRSSAIERCLAPILNETLLSSWPYSPGSHPHAVDVRTHDDVGTRLIEAPRAPMGIGVADPVPDA